MQLRDIAAALRKSEDVNDKLRALRNLEGALLAAPDELKHYAGKTETDALSMQMHTFDGDHRHTWQQLVHKDLFAMRVQSSWCNTVFDRVCFEAVVCAHLAAGAQRLPSCWFSKLAQSSL